MRRLLPLLLLLICSACGSSTVVGTPSPPPAPTLPTLGEILTAPVVGPISAVGLLYITRDGAALVDQLHLAPDGTVTLLDDQGFWLGQLTSLPVEPSTLKLGESRSLTVAFSGDLVGPGRYGPGGQYRYRLDQPQLTPLTSRELTIALLLTNSALYEGQPVRLQGHLLTAPGTALLVERLGPGGVPDPQALQVKLAAAPRDPSLRAALHTTADGRIAFGLVEITGLWRGGTLYPLTAVPR